MKTFLEMIAIGFPYEVRAVSCMLRTDLEIPNSPTPFRKISLSCWSVAGMGILGYSLGSDGALFATTVAKDQLVWAVSLSASSSLFSGRQAQSIQYNASLQRIVWQQNAPPFFQTDRILPPFLSTYTLDQLLGIVIFIVS